MKLTNISRILGEILPTDVQKWIGKVLDPINSFLSQVKTGMDKGLSVNDNLRGAIKTVKVENGSQATVQYDTGYNPKIIVVGKVEDLTDLSWVPTYHIGVTWRYDGSKLTVTFYGLNNAHSYLINLLILED